MAQSRGQKRTVARVMRERKHGALKSSSGRKVTSRKQAIAIAMSESGQSRKRPAKRKSSRTGTARVKTTRAKTTRAKATGGKRKATRRRAPGRKTTRSRRAAK